MNIFYLDKNPTLCAEYHADKHVIKMIVETLQILSSAYYFTGEPQNAPYKLTHANHPACIWARQSKNNWLWLRELGLALCKEYTYRYGRTHKCQPLLEQMPICNLPDTPMTPMVNIMADEFIISDDITLNYRFYYQTAKSHLLNWKNRQPPHWTKSE